jgi:prepilin-type processing-associated H-X9-DG protein
MKDAFTLVEILVVIGIVIILVALLVPVVLKSRESALQYYCMNNLQVIGRAYHAYAMDYNDGIVPLIRASAHFPNSWFYEQLRPYGAAIIAEEAIAGKGDAWLRCPKQKITPYGAYAQNANIGFKDYLGSQSYFPVKFSQIPNPDSIVIMCEMTGNRLFGTKITTNLGKDWGQGSYLMFPTPHFGELSAWDRWIHGDANVLFCDGHTESINWKNNRLTADNVKVPQ